MILEVNPLPSPDFESPEVPHSPLESSPVLKTWWRRALPRALNRGQASARVVLSGWEAVIGLGTTPGWPPSWVAAMELPSVKRPPLSINESRHITSSTSGFSLVEFFPSFSVLRPSAGNRRYRSARFFILLSALHKGDTVVAGA